MTLTVNSGRKIIYATRVTRLSSSTPFLIILFKRNTLNDIIMHLLRPASVKWFMLRDVRTYFATYFFIQGDCLPPRNKERHTIFQTNITASIFIPSIFMTDITVCFSSGWDPCTNPCPSFLRHAILVVWCIMWLWQRLLRRDNEK